MAVLLMVRKKYCTESALKYYLKYSYSYLLLYNNKKRCGYRNSGHASEMLHS